MMIGSFAKAKTCHLLILDLRVGGREGSLSLLALHSRLLPLKQNQGERTFCGGGAAVQRLNQGRNQLIKVK